MLRFMLLVQHQFPAAYWHPRWPTRDHVMPVGIFWQYVAGAWANIALERLSTMRAIGMALAAGDRGEALARRLILEDQQTAFAPRTPD